MTQHSALPCSLWLCFTVHAVPVMHGPAVCRPCIETSPFFMQLYEMVRHPAVSPLSALGLTVHAGEGAGLAGPQACSQRRSLLSNRTTKRRSLAVHTLPLIWRTASFTESFCSAHFRVTDCCYTGLLLCMLEVLLQHQKLPPGCNICMCKGSPAGCDTKRCHHSIRHRIGSPGADGCGDTTELYHPDQQILQGIPGVLQAQRRA